MPEVWYPTAGGSEISQDKLEDVARELLAVGADIHVWLFFGEMGSGKTTLIKVIGKLEGVTEVMSSPTFSIVNEYDTGRGGKIYHFDLYRLKNEKEVFDIGAEEYFDSNERCMVEWAEKLGNFAPASNFKIRIKPTGPHHRKIEYQRV